MEVFLLKQSSRDIAEKEGWASGSSPRAGKAVKEVGWGADSCFFIDGAWLSGLDSCFYIDGGVVLRSGRLLYIDGGVVLRAGWLLYIGAWLSGLDSYFYIDGAWFSGLDSCFYRAVKLAGSMGSSPGLQCLFSHSLLSLVRPAADMLFSLRR